MEKINGVINKVTYYNEQNGFGVVRITLDFKDQEISHLQPILISNNLVVTTNFSRAPVVGEEYSFIGEFVNTQYGLQFKAKTYHQRLQKTLVGVVNFLSSELFKGIGKKTATRIYETLGPNCLEIILQNKESLDKVKNLTQKQKETIYQTLQANQEQSEVLSQLLNFGLTMHMSVKIYKKLKNKTLTIIKENPYRLISLVEGIGFYRADKIALSVGIKEDSPVRIQALITYYLRIFTYSNGNTYLEKDELFSRLCKIINQQDEILTFELFEENLEILAKNKKIIIDEDGFIYDKHIYLAEEMFAKKVCEILNAELNPDFSSEKVEQIFNIVQENSSIIYSKTQIKAILTALKENIAIITGGPGTGKVLLLKQSLNQ